MLESNHFRKQTINCCYYTQVSFAIMLETTIFFFFFLENKQLTNYLLS